MNASPIPPNTPAPVRWLPGDTAADLEDTVALCLSGGGYRAMLFHAGVLWRLNEVGWLDRLDRVSSVSGGSIAAGALALAWGKNELAFQDGKATNLVDRVVLPLRGLAGRTVDILAALEGLLPGTAADHAAHAYRDHLFGPATLGDLPERPLFIINATSLQTGDLFRFSRPYVADWRVGSTTDPALPLALAVAASAAFPPFLAPAVIDLRDHEWQGDGAITDPAYRQRAVLADGGVYDNLGLETAWKRCRTVLVSDAGGHMNDNPDPHHDPARQMIRVMQVIDNQVRDLRKRECIAGYTSGDHAGAYWSIRSDIADFHVDDVLGCPVAETTALAQTPTRLAAMPDELQERLINWGYAICDAALRAHVEPHPQPPTTFPYPDAGVGPGS
jgi:NTE family protein